jgi:hypothetical protein
VTCGEIARRVRRLGVNRPHRVDHPARRKIAARGRDGVPRRQTPAVALGAQALAGFEDRTAAATVNGAVDPASAEEGRIRRVDDDVDFLLGDVAFDDLDTHPSTVAP